MRCDSTSLAPLPAFFGRAFAILLVLALLAATIPPAGAQTAGQTAAQTAAPAAGGLAGHWEGNIELPGMKLAYDIDFAGSTDAWTGDITIPAQGAKDLPLADVLLSGESVSFRIAGIPGDPTFQGTLSPDGATIAGTFTQGGQSFPFTLASQESPVARARAALAGFDDVVEKGLAELHVPGVAVAILVDGEPVLMKGYGTRDREQNLPVTERTLFAIGSSTKAFTAFVLGTLVDEGRLDWDAPVQQYLPELRLKDKEIERNLSARDLVTHRCGLPRHDLVWYNNTELTRAEIVSRLAYLEPNHQLRETWQYNNLAFLTAGYLAEKITGKSWEECVRERIFAPLGMSASVFSVEEMQQAGDFALGYEEREGTVQRIPFRTITNMGPAGSINSNIEEMTRWVAVQLQHGACPETPLIQATTLAELHTPQMVIATPPNPEFPEMSSISYAMGWFVQPYRGHYRLQHGGNIDGFSAYVSFLPQDDIGFAILSNMNGTPLPQVIEYAALDRLLGVEGRDWIAEVGQKKNLGEQAEEVAKKAAVLEQVKGTKPSRRLGDYAGEYENPGYGTLRIEYENKSLAMILNHIRCPLEHWHYDVFNGAKGGDDPTFEDTKLQFLSDMEGGIEGLRVILEPSVSEIVFTRKPDARLSDPAFLAGLAGEYVLSDETVRLDLKGDRLVLVVPGQNPYDLVPSRGTDFKLKGLTGYTVRFVLGPTNEVEEVRFVQPNGVFTGKPKPRS